MPIRLFSLTLCTLLAIPHANAQQAGCQDLAGFSDFDFWVGEWEVFDNNTGNRAGENSIVKMEDGCMLMESWSGGGGATTGTSINYYNSVTREWRQVWVSGGAYAIDIVGGLRGESMVLEGSIYNFAGAVWNFRGTWTPNADGSVRQFFEQFNHDTEEWAPWFDGRYVRKKGTNN
ncbi:MAG: hypothetical protein MI746_12340 [Pseudomonadales bacterium]|nr:hypothetical protein [Pseudomonadales bacterium]